MAYEKQEWTPRETVISTARMEHIEDGIEAAHSGIEGSVESALQAALAGLPQVQSGRVVVTPDAASPTSVDVVFPTPFRAAPEMTASALSGVPGVVQEVTVDAITTNGARIWMRRTNAVTTSVSWIAVAS